MARNLQVGVMGPGNSATKAQCDIAHRLGFDIAQYGHTLLSGGGPGTMEEACRGAKDNGGTVLGVLSGMNTERMNRYVDHWVATNMGSGRNFINVQSCDLVIAIASDSPGTLSEIMLALATDVPLLVFDAQPDLCSVLARIRPDKPAITTGSWDQVEAFLNI